MFGRASSLAYSFSISWPCFAVVNPSTLTGIRIEKDINMLAKFRFLLVVYGLSLASGCTNSGWNGYNQPAYPIGPYPGTGYPQPGYPAGYAGPPTAGPIPGSLPNGVPQTGFPQTGTTAGGLPNYSQPLPGYPTGTYPGAYPGGYPGTYPQAPGGVPLNQFGPSQPIFGR